MKTLDSLYDQVDTIDSREDLAAFVSTLSRDLRENPEEWENIDLPMYLDALVAWIASIPQREQNLGYHPLKEPSWRILAEMLLAPRYYE